MVRKGRWVAVLGAVAVLAVVGCQASRLLRQPYHEPAVHAAAPR